MTQEKIKVIELFSGIGAQRKALERIGINYEVVCVSDIDKYAHKSYEAIFGKTDNFGDITKIEKLPYADLWTYSFPCTDLSVAGKCLGLNNTRSGLLYEVERLLNISKENNELPKYLLLENVKNLVGKKFKSDFNNWLIYLDKLGYNTYWQVLNAKDYEIPQNRERVFALSIRKDIDTKTYKFPDKKELKLKIKDIAEKNVDAKYYLKEETQRKFFEKYLIEIQNKKNDELIKVGNASVYDKILKPTIAASRGRNLYNPSDRTVGASTEQRLEFNKNGISNTLTTVQKDNYLVESGFRIRKLTPLECWRLMGFDDEDFYKAKNDGLSDTQLYKQAGNSIVVNVLEGIFKNLFGEN